MKEEEPLFVFRLSIKPCHETKRLDSHDSYNLSDVFDLERGEWYDRGNVVNGGVLLFRR